MSLAADPNQTFNIVMESDKKLPEDKQPKFIFRYMTVRQHKMASAIREKMKDAKTILDVTDMTIEMLRLNLCGWKNVFALGDQNRAVPVEFSLDKIEDILSPDDIYDLATAGRDEQTLSGEDKKKLDSLSPSDTDSSAAANAKA